MYYTSFIKFIKQLLILKYFENLSWTEIKLGNCINMEVHRKLKDLFDVRKIAKSVFKYFYEWEVIMPLSSLSG